MDLGRRPDGTPRTKFYNMKLVKFYISKAHEVKKKYRVFRFIPDRIKKQIIAWYYAAYVDMYDYVLYRIFMNKDIDEDDREDIAQSLFPYLLAGGNGFFKEIYYILDNDFLSIKYKFAKIQRLLDIFIRSYWWRSYLKNKQACRVIEEEMIDPQYVEDMRTSINPEDIAIIKYERETLATLLVTAPPFCRIDKNHYEKIARMYLKRLFVERIHEMELIRNANKKGINKPRRFVTDYVMYSIRKIIKDYRLGVNDISYTGIFDTAAGPTFSDILAKKLGIVNTFRLASPEDKTDKVAKHNEVRNQKYVSGVNNEQINPKFLVFDQT